MQTTSVNSFGRLIAPKDGRDYGFTMRTAQPQITKTIGKPKPRVLAYREGPLLDQGPAPHCVGYAGRGFLDAAPLMSKATDGPSAAKIYHDAQERDEWPGTDYAGSSVRGGMKALVDSGHISSYVWGQNVDDMILWMNGGYGTCVVGTSWYAEMSQIDRHGFVIEPASTLVTPIGGHAYRINWWDAKRRGFLMRNSWGTSFGILKHGIGTGYAYVRREFMERLLWEDGEVAAPTQVKIRATPITL